MRNPRIELPLISPDPLRIVVTRGDAEESVHDVDIALVDGDGHVLLGLGDIERPVFPRSAMKPLQSIALAETVMESAGHHHLSAEEIALITASHNAEPRHVEAAANLLDRFGIDPAALVCGAHWSLDQPTAIAQARMMETPTRLHNNCSGKHAGMLVLARIMGASLEGYNALSHPVQQRILGILEAMTGTDLAAHPHGIDGCGAPALSGPLGNWARAFALFAGGGVIPERREKACALIRDSIAAAPEMIAGTGRACTAISRSYGAAITAKTGAEGVFAAAFHELGLGLMVKTRDGNKRGAEVAIGAVIHALGYDHPDEVRPFFRPGLKNWAGEDVGSIYAKDPLRLDA
ncbi:asparaginase [Alphaproteobacteria bacterium LSUCC0684]